MPGFITLLLPISPALRPELVLAVYTLKIVFGKMEYAVAGNGPPVIMIHGTGGGSDQGLSMAQQLIKNATAPEKRRVRSILRNILPVKVKSKGLLNDAILACTPAIMELSAISSQPWPFLSRMTVSVPVIQHGTSPVR